MRVRVLGCHGGESPSHRPACFLVDDKLLLDAGSAARGLTLDEQARIDYAFLTHSHLDHVKGLPLLLDNVVGARKQPLTVYCTDGTADALERHLFNGLLWPDFTRIPSPERPICRVHRLRPSEPVALEGFVLQAVPVRHTIECHGVLVTTKSGTLAYSGDTGPSEELWRAVNAAPKLRAVLCEVSFPSELDELARISGHLTPRLLAAELEKYHPQVAAPVLVVHVKPAHFEQVRQEIAALGDPRVRLLHPLEELQF